MDLDQIEAEVLGWGFPGAFALKPAPKPVEIAPGVPADPYLADAIRDVTAPVQPFASPPAMAQVPPFTLSSATGPVYPSLPLMPEPAPKPSFVDNLKANAREWLGLPVYVWASVGVGLIVAGGLLYFRKPREVAT